MIEHTLVVVALILTLVSIFILGAVVGFWIGVYIKDK